jgi:amidase
MGLFREYENYDAVGLAELIRKGEITAKELCETAIEKIQTENPRLNAVVTPMFDIGRKTASEKLYEGAFKGVPFLLKDLMCAHAGVPLTSGCKAYRDFIPDRDSEMTARFKKAGLVVLGKTNTPEFGLMGVTEPDLFGPCRNPWNTDHTPGGSSGGSASAVAAGMLPMASGGDGGGSIRIPGSYCGLFGLKPSRGRNPCGPYLGRPWQGAVQEHVLTRSVRDSAACLDAVHGPDPGAPYEIRPPERPFLEEAAAHPGKLRIGFSTASPIGTAVHPECVRATEEAVKLLQSLGHIVEEAQTGVDGKALAKSYMMLYFGEVAADLAELSTYLGRKVKPGDVEPGTFTLGLLGKAFSAEDFVKAMRCWDQSARRMGMFFRDYDLYLTPTTAHPPAKIGELKPRAAEKMMMNIVNSMGLGRMLKASGIMDQLAQKGLERTPFTQVANLCGLPAMSVPLHWTPDGLPCGVQFIGSFGNEAALFRLAGQLEKARPWFDKRPPLGKENPRL